MNVKERFSMFIVRRKKKHLRFNNEHVTCDIIHYILHSFCIIISCYISQDQS
jgi:hypothetical protein